MIIISPSTDKIYLEHMAGKIPPTREVTKEFRWRLRGAGGQIDNYGYWGELPTGEKWCFKHNVPCDHEYVPYHSWFCYYCQRESLALQRAEALERKKAGKKWWQFWK